MKKTFSPLRLMRFASLGRYYALVFGIVVILLVIFSITKVLQNKPQKQSFVLPLVLISYQKISDPSGNFYPYF